MSSQVTLRADEKSFQAYLAVPARPNGGSVVVLQEIFGINANIRSVADYFAEKGYHAIAPDLFWRQQPGVELEPTSETDRETATALMTGLDQPRAIGDALAAALHVRTLPDANGKVGVVGYCLGGKLAYLMAMQPGVDAAVAYYGVAIQAVLDKMEAVRCKLLLHVAERDHLCPPDAQDAIKQAAAKHADLVTVMRYPGVGHAFARRKSPAYDAAAAERADAATLALLGEVVAESR
jgi:carboxymethylenebutenolidase